MEEKEVLSLIDEGENERIDFKRELDLKSARGKAKFVIDVISLANSAPDGSYLLIGFDDDKSIVGIDKLEEERIQHIAQTYIDPVVVLRCFLVPIARSGSPSVGVIEIKATRRPHKVRRPIGKLAHDDIFVRHGSIVAKASLEEIIRMNQLHRELQGKEDEDIPASISDLIQPLLRKLPEKVAHFILGAMVVIGGLIYLLVEFYPGLTGKTFMEAVLKPTPTPTSTFTTTPTPTATFTATSTPTVPFTPTATSTATSMPTNTLTPTNTPTPTATNTPTPTEIPPVSGHFAAVWNMVQEKIGCASGSAITGHIAEENFEGGKMFWRKPIDHDQVLVLFNDGTWQIVKHSPIDEDNPPEFSCPDAHTPSQCPPTPKLGFGIVWCDTPAIRSSLGNAIDCERGYQSLMQQFERGFMLQTDSGDTYVLYNNGQWERR